MKVGPKGCFQERYISSICWVGFTFFWHVALYRQPAKPANIVLGSWDYGYPKSAVDFNRWLYSSRYLLRATELHYDHIHSRL